MFCGECGAKLSEDLEKCPVCGTYVSEHYVPQVTDVAEDSQPGVQVEKASEYTVSVERQSGPEITAYSENESFSDQYAVEEKEQKAFPEKNDKNGKWMYAAGVCMVLAMVGVIGFSIWNDNYNASDVADSAEQYEEQNVAEAEPVNEDYEDDFYDDMESSDEIIEEDDWLEEGTDDGMIEEEPPNLQAALYLSDEEIDPEALPLYSGSMVVIGDYLYLKPFGKDDIHVYDRNMNWETVLAVGDVEQLNTDGRQLFYVRNKRLYRADPDGSNEVWQIDFADEVVGSYTVVGNTLYFSSRYSDTVFVEKYDMENDEEIQGISVYDASTYVNIMRWEHIPYMEISTSKENQCINLDTMEREDIDLNSGQRGRLDISDSGELILRDSDGNELFDFGSEEELNAGPYGCCEDYFYFMVVENKEDDSADCITYLYRFSTGEMNRIVL